LALYAAMICLCIALFLESTGRERTLVAGWYPGVLLSPVKMFFPAAVRTVDFLELVGITVAFVAAVLIVWEFPKGNHAPPGGIVPDIAERPSSDQQHPGTGG
jgi:hypothetical protein